MTLASAIILLILIIDPIGNIPINLSVLREVAPARRWKIILRESLIATVVLYIFLFAGKPLMDTLQLSDVSVSIAGGIVLFIIAVKMIFPTRDGVFGEIPGGEPLVFPLAVPLFAGPSAMATLILFSSKYPDQLPMLFLALTIACVTATIVSLAAPLLMRWMGPRGLSATERLMGLLISVVAIEMLIQGFRDIFPPIASGQ